MKRAFRILLRLYPRRFQEAFSEEMLATLERVRREEAERGAKQQTFFLLREVWGLLVGICVERLPLGRVPSIDASPLSDIAQEEERVRFHLAQTIDCIATHRFAGARFHAAEEDRARERLQPLRSFGGDEGPGTKFPG